ncbi:MAG: prepilin-type cleavage/methylation domain-containing protein, partial [Planctomycetota bacterium]
MQDATIKSAGVVALIVLVGVAALVPVLGYARQIARCQQNMDQLRGIHQGCVVFSQGSKSGGGDGFFPGVTSRGVPLLDTPRNRIDGGSRGLDATVGNHNDIHGYDRDGNGDIDPDEMNDPETGEGFVQYVFAELLTGDFIPAGSADYFVNPADTLKGSFDPGDPGEAGRFDMSKISYTLLNVSVDALYGEWRETVNPRAIVFADRAVG